jgi:hypothetical protein
MSPTSIKFQIAFECDNAAFGSPNTEDFGYEVARILREVAEKMESGYAAGMCLDYNGNHVGEFGIRMARKRLMS